MHREGPNGLRSLLRVIGSLWVAAVLLVLLLVAMAFATVFEALHGTEQALAAFYYSWWFEALLFLTGLNVLASLLLRYPYSRRHVGFVLTHVSILVTFGGALVTKHFAVDGRIGIAEGQTVDEFNADGEALTITSDSAREPATLDLHSSLSRRFRATDVHGLPGLTVGDLHAEIIRYLPDSKWVQHVFDDGSTPRPAVEVSLSGSGRDDPTWVFARQAVPVGGVRISYRQVTDREELTRLVNAAPSTQPASMGTVRIEYAGATHEFPVEEGLTRAVPLGDTGFTARVLRYLPHATVGSDNEIVNASMRPENPYVEVEVVGPEGRETHRAFARFPDFESMHGASRTAGLKLTLVVDSADDVPPTPVEVLGGPDGELYVRFAPEGAATNTRPLEVGTAVESPWRGRKFAVLRKYDHAQAEWSLEPVDPVGENRTPAILVHLKTTAGEDQRWIQKHRSVRVSLGDARYELTYSNKVEPLDFSVKLDSFRIIPYPGGERPRSFESRVTIEEPRTGRSQTRVISMNHPLSFGGYTFYQSSYRMEPDQAISYLSVARDPGKPIVFAGYIGLMVGMLIVLGTRMAERGRRAAGAAGGPTPAEF